MGIDVKKYPEYWGHIFPILPLVYGESLSYLETLAKLTHKVNEVIDAVNTSTSGILDDAKKYTDGKIAEQYESIEKAVQDVKNIQNELNVQYRGFEQNVNARLGLTDGKIRGMQEQLTAEVKAVNARTDLAIEQNNDYLLAQMAVFLRGITVINYFTGEEISVQGMFDYLASLHTTGGIDYDTLVARDKTYNQYVAYDMSYTDLALRGGTIIM